MVASSIIAGAFIVIVFMNSHPVKCAGGANYSSLTNRESSNCMKGIAAILIVFSHAHYYSTNLGLMKLFKPFGYIGVSLFFFCSGYGVMHQYILNKNYLNGFLTKRLRCVYVPYLIATFMYALFIQNINIEYAKLIKNVFLVDRILPFAWYIPVILGWYLLFFSVLKIIGDSKKACAVFLCANIIWYIIGYLLGLSSFYYNSTICLTIGCFVAVEKKICQILSKLMSLIVVTTAFILSVVLLVLLGGRSNLIYSVCIFASSVLFVLFLLSIGTRITFDGAILKALGIYSYEIYLTQGIAYSLAYQISSKWENLFWICFVSMLVFTTVGLNLISKVIKNRRI